MTADPEAVVIGSGPNGLVAACLLAIQGLRVDVIETNPRHPGGAVASAELTVPGFVHDVGATFFPFARLSPAFAALDLEARGITWCNARFETCHVTRGDEHCCVARYSGAPNSKFADAEDAARWERLAQWAAEIAEALFESLWRPFPSWPRLGLRDALRVAAIFARSGRHLAHRNFRSEPARCLWPALALHTDVGPDDALGAGIGFALGVAASAVGFPVPQGGAQRITNALVRLLERHGGRLHLGTRAVRIVVSRGRAVAVRTADGTEIPAERAVLVDTSAPSLLVDLLEARTVPRWVRRRMERFTSGWGTFKVDWALTDAVPWLAEGARQSAVVHTGESLEDLARFTTEVRDGRLPTSPFLVVGQPSLLDPSRAPPGHHTLSAYTHVPTGTTAQWDADREHFADRIEASIERLAPGFQSSILGRHLATPRDLERSNANLLGGDIGGGSARWYHQLCFRPLFPFFRYQMPVRNVVLCSSYAHPGGGVHGMCGFNAARRVLAHLR